MNKFSNNVILASSSPRRKEILADMGVKYEVIPANIDESEIKSRFPFLLVEKLAKAKAEHIACEHIACEHIACEHRSDTVIAADTIVVLDGKVYGKPHDRARAFEMIKSLNGRTHVVYTGVCVTCEGKKVVACVKSLVTFKTLTDEQIYAYIDDCKPFDKAGAYGIQDKRIVKKYSGSYSNIMGLPKEKLGDILVRVGVINGNNRIID